jgi:hypothetical protein
MEQPAKQPHPAPETPSEELPVAKNPRKDPSFYDSLPSDFTFEGITANYIEHIKHTFVVPDETERTKRLRRLRYAIHESMLCGEDLGDRRTLHQYAGRERHPFLNDAPRGDVGATIQPPDTISALPLSGKWPFPPSRAEYLILNAELSLRGMVIPMEIKRDFETFDEFRTNGHIMPESFVIISRSRYIEDCKVDEQRARVMNQPYGTPHGTVLATPFGF